MGLALRNPLVASASPLSYTVDGVRRLADAGVGAVVLFSLFEEQLREEAARNARLVDEPAESFAEALDYFPAVAEEDAGPRRYLSLVERAAAAVDVPVIASLNGVTPEGWTDYARAMQDAGAAAIELNIYYLPGDPHISGRDVEQRHIDVLERVKDAVTVPVAVKLSPYFSSTGEIALRLDEAGADALVLFNRFLQPDIDPEELAVVPTVALSSPADARLPRTWIALLRGRVRAALAATTGVEGPADVAKYLLAGADVVMTASALLRHGPEYASTSARRAVRLDGAQGVRIRRRAARHARPCPPAPTRRNTSARATSPRSEPPTPAPTAPGEGRRRLSAGGREAAASAHSKPCTRGTQGLCDARPRSRAHARDGVRDHALRARTPRALQANPATRVRRAAQDNLGQDPPRRAARRRTRPPRRHLTSPARATLEFWEQDFPELKR